MIVDDENDVLHNVKNFLKENEINVVCAENSRQALQHLEKEETVDLILIDTPMPCSDKTALFSMKPNIKNVPSEMDNFLQKPFTKEQLLTFLQDKLE
jgi:DNA-binding NtrC family response regulator